MDISFKDIVKLIHPDTNPNITDASGKMSLVLKYKKDTAVLWNLAVKWCLVSGSYNVTSPESPNMTSTPVNKGWGYDRENPVWTPSNEGWKTTEPRRPPPRRPVRTPNDMSVHDYVIFAVNSEIKHGIIMNIREYVKDGRIVFAVDILSNSTIVVKSVNSLQSSPIIKKVRKATKGQIQSNTMMYDILKRR